MVQKFESHNITELYPNPCCNEACHKGTALNFLIVFFFFVFFLFVFFFLGGGGVYCLLEMQFLFTDKVISNVISVKVWDDSLKISTRKI